MADIKTHIRELSVAVGVSLSVNRQSCEDIDLISVTDFFQYASRVVNNDISIANNILSIGDFSGEYLQILNNGLKLGHQIVEKFNVKQIDIMIWCGGDTQKDDPTDLIINDLRFSLKEQSFILENMGLYKFLSLLTTSSFSRGLHVFNHFAKAEYEKWFTYTLNKAIETAKGWRFSNDKYISTIGVSDNTLLLKFVSSSNERVISEIPNHSTTEVFQKRTTTKTREKVFSKWINEKLYNDHTYLELKKHCSETAGAAMCQFVMQNLCQNGLQRLLQVRNFEYYYAKSTQHETTVLRVPSVADFANEITIKSVDYSVPVSQLNIITTIENTKTGNELRIRNECRFSHGQFNGTPEAKMYYNGDLTIIYEEI